VKKPLVAIISFPGNNCEVESVRAIRESNMEARLFRWNDDRKFLDNCDGYFLPGGFAYEDRGRSGMVAGRDSLLEFLAAKAGEGKAIIGNCNGAQVLIESGLIPLHKGLHMSLARNAIRDGAVWSAPGFLSEWIWITSSCDLERCATSNWKGVMHLPIAHGEGRFTTKDKDLMQDLKRNDQIAFSYCDANGNVGDDPIRTPNGSMFAIAGLCNPAGNVVALMPHPERTPKGKPYFDALRWWLTSKKNIERTMSIRKDTNGGRPVLPARIAKQAELFIDTIIVNNEERTVEQAARRVSPSLRLKQFRYVELGRTSPRDILTSISLFNPHKEVAYVRRGNTMYRWDSTTKKEEPLDSARIEALFSGLMLLRTDEPDTLSSAFGEGSKAGCAYVVKGIDEQALGSRLLEIFANPHASVLEELVSR
jgi:phosphoribosylformylglycinamidine synthase